MADDSYPVLPLRDVVVLPGSPMSLIVGRAGSVAAVRAAEVDDGPILLLTQKEGEVLEPTPEDLAAMGTLAVLDEVIALPNGHLKVFVMGRSRARPTGFSSLSRGEGWRAQAVKVDPVGADHPEVPMLAAAAQEAMGRLMRLEDGDEPELPAALSDPSSPDALADLLGATLELPARERLALLEEPDVRRRLERVVAAIRKELGFAQARHKLKARVDRERALRDPDGRPGEPSGGSAGHRGGEQGSDDDELTELTRAIEARSMPAEVRERVDRELRRLRSMNPMSAEASVLRTWLDWVVQLPWEETGGRTPNLAEAKAVLDTDHHGLEEVKERVLEYLAVDVLGAREHAPVLCLVGPPGVGKTSLARSIARATGRPFARLALGGVRDEAEIRGHRRTYIGAMPGRLLHAIKRAGALDGLILLDEVDKMGADVRGDPASALLEVLDPEQNKAFNDHYLDMDYDLSKVMFLCTANRLHDIPPPLLDRLEIIELSGYTDEEKKAIARRYLLPRQQQGAGLEPETVSLSDGALDLLIEGYTREAGVRSLERTLGRLCRKRARAQLEQGETKPWDLLPDRVRELLGPAPYDRRMAGERDEVGVVKGLSVGHAGGEMLEIEVAIVPGKGGLRTTGRAGDVLKESAEAARTWLRSRRDTFGLADDWHETTDLHIHYPGLPGGVEGPSAGVAMALALVSGVTGRAVRRDVAMTGEVSLRGRVLPVGGIKDKVLAAWRGGASVVYLPSRNGRDLHKVSEEVRAALDIRLVDTMDEVIATALRAGPGEEAVSDDVSEEEKLAH